MTHLSRIFLPITLDVVVYERVSWIILDNAFQVCYEIIVQNVQILTLVHCTLYGTLKIRIMLRNSATCRDCRWMFDYLYQKCLFGFFHAPSSVKGSARYGFNETLVAERRHIPYAQLFYHLTTIPFGPQKFLSFLRTRHLHVKSLIGRIYPFIFENSKNQRIQIFKILIMFRNYKVTKSN